MQTLSFAKRPSLEPVIADEVWELTQDWHIAILGRGVVVPKGFLTDGASIPRFLWRVCGHPMGTQRVIPAIVHDAIYAGAIAGFTRKEADQIYADALVELGFPKRKARLEYAALRLFGAAHWQEN